MKPIHGRNKPLAWALLLAAAAALLVTAAPGAGRAQFPEQQRPPPNLGELRRLLEVARESGFSEEEVRKITIEDDGQVVEMARKAQFSAEEMRSIQAEGGQGLIVVYEFLRLLEQKKKEEAERIRRLREREYLTVQDFFSDLNEGRMEDLTKLRNKPEYNR